jgi:phospholipase/carboxylesterase
MGDVLRHGAEPAAAKALCVFVHGRGQTPEEMVDLVVRHLPQDVAYALPRANGKSCYGARAVDPLTDATRSELAGSLAHLRRVIDGLRDPTPRPILLAGFSQGACLSLELAYTGQVLPDALAALTGCRVGATTEARPSALPHALPVYLMGGDADPWIPLTAFAETVADLDRQGAALHNDLFPGRAHELSRPELAMLSAILFDLSSTQAPGLAAAR